MWAALRHRKGQAIALALVSALVATCAVFAPVFARSIDQALLRVHVVDAGPETSATTLSLARTQSDDAVLPPEVAGLVPDDLAAVSDEPISGMRKGTEVVPQEGKLPSPVVLRTRSDVCEHLEIAGRCPRAAGEIVVSSADAEAWGWKTGTRLEVPQEKKEPFAPEPRPVELTVVGVYEAPADEPRYWLGDRPDGKSGLPNTDRENVPGVDDLITTEKTFVDAFPRASAVVVLPLDPEAATLESLPRAASATTTLGEENPALEVGESAGELVDGVAAGQDQTAVIVPFVMVQLALLSVLVLFLVARAAVDQRRHEVALARLRGHSRRGARRLLLTELVTPVLLGLPLGVLTALGLAVVVRSLMLPADLPFEVPLGVLPWLLGALLLSVLAVYLAARPVLREPVGDLLRSVSPGAAGGSVVVDTVVVVLAGLGALGLATGALSGPGALAAPTLLAIAVGVLAARLVPHLASLTARRAMRRGRVAVTLAGHGIGRRPAARRVLVVTTVATAIAVFGANAVVVAEDNRRARAELETGAPAVMSVDVTKTPQLLEAADALDEEGVEASPVAVIHPRSADSAATIAVDPDTLGEVAHPDTVEGLDLDALALPEQEPIRIPGETATASVEWDLEASGDGEPPTLSVEMTTPSGDDRAEDIATLGPGSSGRTRIDENLYCEDGCRLSGLSVATSGSPGSRISGTVTIRGLEVDGTPLPVTGEDTWVSTRSEGGTGIDVATKGDALTLDIAAIDGADVETYVADVPRPVPALASNTGTEKGDEFQVVDVAGEQTDVRVHDHVAELPAVTDEGVLVSLPALARVKGDLDSSRSDTQIWLADASSAGIERAREVLAAEGVSSGPVATTAEADRVYDRSASGWGLQLALVGGGLAVLLAGLVLVVLAVTGWRATVRDLAALRISGVGGRAVSGALRAEHLVSVAVGILLGTGCALVGSWVALPSIPLFTTPAAVPVADLSPAWPVVAIATGGVALVLLLLALVLAGAVLRRLRLDAARGEPT